MTNNAMAIMGCIGVTCIIGLIGWRAGEYKGRRGTGRRLHRWLFITVAVIATATLAGCDSGHTAGAPSAGPAASQTPATKTPAPLSPNSRGNTARCITSAAKGSCGPYRYSAITADGQNPGPTVGQNVWSPIPGWSQTLIATNPGNWYAVANIPAGNTSVVSFPNTGQDIAWVNGTPPPLSGYTSIYSSFSENMNGTSRTDAEAAYDIWLNNWKNEVMIQHDFSALRTRCDTLEATATFGGSGGVPVQRWNLCQFGSELIWQLAGRSEHSGKVNILAMLTWLVGHRYLPQRSGLTALSYGFEICSTGGRPETFRVNGFSISAR
jgi:hypothetical protein